MAHCVQQARSLEEVKGASFVFFFTILEFIIFVVENS